MKTFGEFFDAVSTWTQGNSAFEASFFLDEWKDMVSAEEWSGACAAELTEELLLRFAEDMANMFRGRLQGISTDAMYSLTIESGHEFLRAIARIAHEHGLAVPIEQIDVPLTFSDALITAHRAREARE